MSQDLLDSLPAPWRLAVAYAPASTRDRWLTLLALDIRLAGVVRSA
jgi:phytoene synthase